MISGVDAGECMIKTSTESGSCPLEGLLWWADLCFPKCGSLCVTMGVYSDPDTWRTGAARDAGHR